MWQPLTTEDAKVEEAIDKLVGDEEVAHAGGDGPEAYGRALWETATNPQVGWRPGARHEIVLIADNVPHTPNVNEGIPPEFWVENPFDTGEEPGGKFGIPDTQWKEGESLEFHATLAKLAAEEKPLAMVDYHHTSQNENENYIHYWEYWAAATGGQAISTEEGSKSLDTRLADIIKESAEGIPPCPPGYERTPATPCKVKPPVKPPPAPTPIIIHVPASSPPVKGKVYILEDGEIEEEDEFPEDGEAEFGGEIGGGEASFARFQGGTLELLGNQQARVRSKREEMQEGVRAQEGQVREHQADPVWTPAPERHESRQVQAPCQAERKGDEGAQAGQDTARQADARVHAG